MRCIIKKQARDVREHTNWLMRSVEPSLTDNRKPRLSVRLFVGALIIKVNVATSSTSSLLNATCTQWQYVFDCDNEVDVGEGGWGTVIPNIDAKGCELLLIKLHNLCAC
jgi:hypothetical protein